jgi:hypothetical protein
MKWKARVFLIEKKPLILKGNILRNNAHVKASCYMSILHGTYICEAISKSTDKRGTRNSVKVLVGWLHGLTGAIIRLRMGQCPKSPLIELPARWQGLATQTWLIEKITQGNLYLTHT